MSSRSGVALVLLLLAGCDRQSAPEPQANAATAPAASLPAEGSAIDRSHKGEAAPAAALTGLDGKAAPLGELRGRPVLVNLWATWCAPCVAEMPTLDRAAAALDGEAVVVAVNQGETPDKVQAFLKDKPLAHARPLLDPDMAISLKLAANLPTTILYDAAGREVWRSTGSRDWSAPASLALIREAGSGATGG
jgi:thiol-disulfide isomerase/thioredoxin